ncbi:dienelactone hydrolase family protein [Sphingomonas sp. UYP23]
MIESAGHAWTIAQADYLQDSDTLTVPFLMHLAGNDEFMPEMARAEIKTTLASKSNLETFDYPGCSHAFSRHGGAHYDAAAAALATRAHGRS